MPIENPIQRHGTRRTRFKKTLMTLGLLAAGFILNLTHAAVDTSSPQSVTLGWNAVPEDGITSYKVYVGTTPQQYTNVLETGLDMTVTVGSLEYGKTYYFAVQAVHQSGDQGPLSAELPVTISLPPLPSGIGMAANAAGLQWSYPRSALGTAPEFLIYQSTDLVNWTLADTVTVSESTGSDTASIKFSWPIQKTSTRMFYRMTAQNWMGESISP